MLSPRCNCPEIDNVSSRSELVFPVTKSDFPVRRAAAGARPCPPSRPASRARGARGCSATLRALLRPAAGRRGATPVQRAASLQTRLFSGQIWAL